MKNKRNKGITLIALVVTIIVLLILAGISIAMLSGNNGILTKAGEARDLTGKKQIEERVQLAYLAALTEGKGQVTEGLLVDELDKEFGENGYELSQDLTKVTIDGKDYEVGGEVTPGGRATKDKNGVKIATTTETTPFLPNPTKNEITNNDLSTGLTIKDEKQNEWVWIEVPKTVTAEVTEDNDIYNALRNYCEPVILKTGSNYKTTTCGWTDEWYAWDEANSTEITESTATPEQKELTNGCGLSLSEYKETKHAMLNSIKNNGGFYIGKYETGNEGGTLNKTYYDDNSNVVVNPESTDDYSWYEGTWSGGKAVIKQNQIPYNWVTCSQAQNLAKGLATDGKQSSLLFGIQWDLVLKFISVKENLGNDNTLLTSNSTTWGNNYNSTYNITNPEAWYSIDYGAKWTKGAYNKTSNGSVLLTTGAHTNFSKQNIFDIAGNVLEWTLEKTSITNFPCSSRGGDYSSSGGNGPASARISYNETTKSYNFISFRVALY